MTKEEAVVANAVVRAMLKPTKNAPISAEETDINLQRAKEAALMSANNRKQGPSLGVQQTQCGKWVSNEY